MGWRRIRIWVAALGALTAPAIVHAQVTTVFPGGSLTALRALSPGLVFGNLVIDGPLEIDRSSDAGSSDVVIRAGRFEITSRGSIVSDQGACSYLRSANVTIEVSGEVLLDGYIDLAGKGGDREISSTSPGLCPETTCNQCFGADAGDLTIRGQSIRATGTGTSADLNANGGWGSTLEFQEYDTYYGLCRTVARTGCSGGDGGLIRFQATSRIDLEGAGFELGGGDGGTGTPEGAPGALAELEWSAPLVSVQEIEPNGSVNVGDAEFFPGRAQPLAAAPVRVQGFVSYQDDAGDPNAITVTFDPPASNDRLEDLYVVFVPSAAPVAFELQAANAQRDLDLYLIDPFSFQILGESNGPPGRVERIDRVLSRGWYVVGASWCCNNQTLPAPPGTAYELRVIAAPEPSAGALGGIASVALAARAVPRRHRGGRGMRARRTAMRRQVTRIGVVSALLVGLLAPLAARGAGRIVGWGGYYYNHGQTTNPLSAATAVSSTGSHSCAIRADGGAVVCWGSDSDGQATPPDSVNGTAGTATAIAVGGRHSCAIQAGSGAVVCWGFDGSGRATPPPSVNGTAGSALAIAVGDDHSCAIQAGLAPDYGTIVCWGSDEYFQATPPWPPFGAKAISAGVSYGCAIKADNSAVLCWGRNSDGQATPPPSVGAAAGGATAIATGYFHSCAIRASDGGVACWGRNDSGQSTPSIAVDGTHGDAASIATGYFHSCAISVGSRLVSCWGQSGAGQADPPDSMDKRPGGATALAAGGHNSCAIHAVSGAVVCWGDDMYGQSTPPPSVDATEGRVTAIAAGRLHSCAIREGNGAVVCWGDDGSGQAAAPASVNGTSGTASAIAAGDEHSCAIRAGGGAVVCWGSDADGKATPPASVNGTSGTASAIATGSRHGCAIQAGSNAAVCWGYDYFGQATPPPSVNGTAGSATAIAGGNVHSCAIQAGGGAVVCWGFDDYGQTTPPPWLGAAAAIAAGNSHTCAIQAGSGAVACWGDNPNARFGQANPPSSVNGLGGTAAAIAAGPNHSCAIQAGSGAVVCWGYDYNDEATPPSSLDGTTGKATAISAGSYHSLAILAPEPAGAPLAALAFASLARLRRRRRAGR